MRALYWMMRDFINWAVANPVVSIPLAVFAVVVLGGGHWLRARADLRREEERRQRDWAELDETARREGRGDPEIAAPNNRLRDE